MSMKKSRPTSPGSRFVMRLSRDELHRGDPYEQLVKTKKARGGRNNQGRITSRHQGAGHKKLYRVIDFRRDKDNIPGRVERIEYDPNRSAHIALVLYVDGERRYIIAPQNLKVDDQIVSGSKIPISVGNCLPLSDIPVGTVIHCVELKPRKGAQLARSAGASARLLAKEGDYATIKLRSNDLRKVRVECRACIGEVGNPQHNLISLGKAGAKRWRGERPHVRGIAMNSVDHPHGGGRGRKTKGRHPVSPWGQPTKGYKTRKNKRTTKYIERHKGK
ncbi:MAG: 50S ribosomal protein L2 [Gammaproteobacteria bacterium]|nr:50S ribosomal protein L2 [Gammaproteobacteria bacterium]